MTTPQPRGARPGPPAPLGKPSVPLPRWVLVLLVAQGALILLAAAFVVGRWTASVPRPAPVEGAQSASPPPTLAAPAENTTAHGSEAGAESAGPSPLVPLTSPSPWPTDGEGIAGMAGPTPPSLATAGSAPSDSAAVAAYFAEMDAIAAAFKSTQDPETLARSIVEQATSGNTSALVALVATQRSLRSRMAAVTAPARCTEHQTKSLSAVDRAIALLERTRIALGGQDAAALAALGTEGAALEQEVRALDALGVGIRRAAGLADPLRPSAAQDR